MRILMLITNFGGGGAQRVFYDHAVAFRDFSDVEEAVFELDEALRIYDTGYVIHDLKFCNCVNYFGPIGRLILRAWRLRKIVHEGKFDLVISHMDGANWVNILSFSKAKKILVVHGTIIWDKKFYGLKQWIRKNFLFPWLYNLADATVAVSQGLARELSSYGRVRNVQAIPNFFDIEAIESQSRKPLTNISHASIFKHKFILVTSGRFSIQKNQINLLKLLAVLRERGVDACMLILGDGELRDDLVRQCKELGLSEYLAWNTETQCSENFDVYFMGYVDNPFQYISQSTLFLFPSNWEGFPLALCEAMICGVTVLSSDCPTGPREILSPEAICDNYDLNYAEVGDCGILLPIIKTTSDLNVWVDAVLALLNDVNSRKKMSISAKCRVRKLDKESVICEWKKLIKDTVSVV